MRLFVALQPPAGALDEIARQIDRVRRNGSDLRWSRRDQWHITLAFLGEVDGSVLPDLRARLKRAAARHPPLRLEFAGGGRFSRNVLWTGVRGDREALQSLAATIAAAARRSGIDIENRPFRPHVTLARSRNRAGSDLRRLVETLTDFNGTPWTADSLHLIESRLGASPAYTTLGTWQLANSAARRGGG